MDGELVKDQVWIISWVICLNIMKLSFSSNLQIYSDKTVNKLDPYHAYISYALFRKLAVTKM